MNTLVTAAAPSAAERFDAWQETISQAFVPLEATPTSDSVFTGSLSCHTVGSAQISDVAGGPVRVERAPRTIRRADPGYIKVGLQTAGHGMVTQAGRTAVLAPGDLAVYDTGRPYTLDFDGTFHMIVLMFPRDMWQIRDTTLMEATARRICGQRGVGGLISPLLRSMPAALLRDDLAHNIHVADALLDLVSAAVADIGGATPVAQSSAAALLVRIKAFVDANLGDVSLSGPEIAAAHHISVRYLQRLFEIEGTTVTAWIRGRRLERIRRELADPRTAAESTGTIAARWGLVDASHFSKAFKAAYGATPREYRLAVRRRETLSPH
jgi:AraC-like DNA-binding protein